jgi:hypothetical protein
VGPLRFGQIRTRPPLAALLIAAALAVGASACGDSETGSETATAPATTGTAPPPATTGTTTGNDGIDPLEEAGTDPVSAPAEGTEIALHERLALARHEGYDRVVFQFRNGLPGYRVEYVEPPLHEDGSGARVEIEGRAFVLVRMEPASGFDLATGEGELVYTGPRRISGADAGTSIVREVVRTGDFEAVLSWAIGLEDRVDFRVLTLDGPPRLVVDFRNH